MTEHKFMGNIEMNTRETVLEISGEGIFWQIENTLKTSARLLGKKILSLVSLFLINACFYHIPSWEHTLPFCDPVSRQASTLDGVTLRFLFQCCRSSMFSSRDQLRFMLQIKPSHCKCVAGKENVRGKIPSKLCLSFHMSPVFSVHQREAAQEGSNRAIPLKESQIVQQLS